MTQGWELFQRSNGSLKADDKDFSNLFVTSGSGSTKSSPLTRALMIPKPITKIQTIKIP